MKTARKFLWCLVWSTVGVYIGTWIFKFWDYTKHPDLYAMMSAPWYTPMIPGTVIAAALLFVEAAAYLLVRRAMKRREEP